MQCHTLFVRRDAVQVPRFSLKPLTWWELGASPEADRETQLGLPWSWWWWMQTCCLLSLGCQWGSPSWWTSSSWKWSCHRLRLLYFRWHCVPSCARTHVVARSGSVSQRYLVSFSFAKQHWWLGIVGGYGQSGGDLSWGLGVTVYHVPWDFRLKEDWTVKRSFQHYEGLVLKTVM